MKERRVWSKQIWQERRKNQRNAKKNKKVHTAWRMSFEERSTIFLFMAHSSSHSMIAFWGHKENAVLPHLWGHSHIFFYALNANLSLRTLKYMGAISPSSRGRGIHSRTMCCLLRGFMCVSMNTQSSSWDSNIRTKVRRNSWGQQSRHSYDLNHSGLK